MTADVELLPLPEPSITHDALGGLHTPKEVLTYARACVAHAAAAKDAEIEAMREERDFLVEEYERAVGCGPQGYTHAAMHLFNAITNAQADQNAKFIEALRAEVQFLRSHRPIARKLAETEARAERLAVALRFARTRFAPYMDDTDRAAFDAALHPTAAQEDNHD